MNSYYIEKMQCGYKELLLLRTFSCGYLGLLYPESTVYTCTVDAHLFMHYIRMYICVYTNPLHLMSTMYPTLHVLHVLRVCPVYPCRSH